MSKLAVMIESKTTTDISKIKAVSVISEGLKLHQTDQFQRQAVAFCSEPIINFFVYATEHVCLFVYMCLFISFYFSKFV